MLVVATSAAGLYLLWTDAHPERPPVPTTPTLEAAGVATHVEHWPAGRPAGRPPLVLVHGFAESAYVWSRIAPLLAADRDVWAYDVRGYGGTELRGPYTTDSDADQLAGVLDAVARVSPPGPRPVVVAHSLGVGITLALALRDPAAMSGMVGIAGDGTPNGTGPAWVHALVVNPFASAGVRFVARDRGRVRALVAAQCGDGCPLDDAAIDRWRAPLLRPGADAAFAAILARPVVGISDEEETRVRVPVALASMGEDRSFGPADAAAAAARLHTDRVAVLPGRRHLALLGDPVAVAGTVGTLLAGLGGRS